jgi:hypothetical protein
VEGKNLRGGRIPRRWKKPTKIKEKSPTKGGGFPQKNIKKH